MSGGRDRRRAHRGVVPLLILGLVAVATGAPAAAGPGAAEGRRDDPGRRLECVEAFGADRDREQGRGPLPECIVTGGGAVRADFNGDEVTDLAVGAPYEDVAGAQDAGAVFVFYGSSSGAFDAQPPQMFTQNSEGVEDQSEAGDLFGFSLAAVDLDCSGKSDLLVGVPGEDLGAAVNAGAVHPLFGRHGGAMQPVSNSAAVPTLLTQAVGEMPDEPESGDLFGYSLTWGRLYSPVRGFEVAIGSPGEEVSGAARAGAVHVLENHCATSGIRGLTDAGSRIWHQDSPGIAGVAEQDDYFGISLTTGWFSDKTAGPFGSSWLVIGVPYESSRSSRVGYVHALPPSASGPTASGSQFWSQNSSGILGGEEAGDLWGQVITAGDVNGDGYADLVVGVPNEDVILGDGTNVVNGGLVQVLYSAGAPGLSATGNQIWTQSNSSGSPSTEVVEAGDGFGAAVSASRDVAGAGIKLVVGAPFEDVGAATNAGVVHVFHGSFGAGLATERTVVLREADTAGRVAGAGDQFGRSLSLWNFNGQSSGFNDLVVGVPFEDVVVGGTTVADAGALLFYPGSGTGAPAQAALVLTEADVAAADGPEPGDSFGLALY